MTDSEPDPRLVRNDTASRYEVWLGDTRAGYATYRETDRSVTFIHTVVGDEFEGRGLGRRLAAFALQDVVGRGKRIVPLCPFIRAYLRGHHEFDGHVDMPARVPS